MSLPATSVNPVHHRDTPTGTPHRSHSFKAQPTQIRVRDADGFTMLGHWQRDKRSARWMQTSKGATNDKGSLPEGGYSPVGDTDGFAASKVPASWSLGARLGKNNFKVGSQPKVDHNQASQTILA